MLGVYPTAAAWRRFAVHPSVKIFDRCSLSFQTVAGPVAVSYRRSGSQIIWQIEVPRESIADIRIPWRYHTATLDGRSITGDQFTLTEGKHTIRIKNPQN